MVTSCSQHLAQFIRTVALVYNLTMQSMGRRGRRGVKTTTAKKVNKSAVCHGQVCVCLLSITGLKGECGSKMFMEREREREREPHL